MVYERLNELRNLDINQTPQRQGTIDAAARLLMSAGVQDPESKINPPSFQKESSSEAEQRANQLRERHRELLPDLTAMPINQFTEGPVYSPARERLETVSAFIDAWRNLPRFFRRPYHENTWGENNRPLLEAIQKYIKGQQEKTMQEFEFTPIEQIPLKDLNLSTRAHNTLKRYDPSPFNPDYPDLLPRIDSVGTLCMRTERELLHIRNFGRFSLDQIKGKLRELGVSLAVEN